MPCGGAGSQNIEHPYILVSLSSVLFCFSCQMHFNFIGKAQFRRAMVSCDSSYSMLQLKCNSIFNAIISPFLPSGLFCPYKLDQSISSCGVWCSFSFLF